MKIYLNSFIINDCKHGGTRQLLTFDFAYLACIVITRSPVMAIEKYTQTSPITSLWPIKITLSKDISSAKRFGYQFARVDIIFKIHINSIMRTKLAETACKLQIP